MYYYTTHLNVLLHYPPAYIIQQCVTTLPTCFTFADRPMYDTAVIHVTFSIEPTALINTRCNGDVMVDDYIMTTACVVRIVVAHGNYAHMPYS